MDWSKRCSQPKNPRLVVSLGPSLFKRQRAGARDFFTLGTPARLLSETIQQHKRFGGLDLPKSLRMFAGNRLPTATLASVDKREWVPIAVRNQFRAKIGLALGLKQGAHTARDFRENRMLAHTMEPVFGVAIIRLAAMQDAMDESAIGIFDLLRNHVGGLEAVVPKQDQSTNELLLLGWK